jgi:hypothetical protein
MDAWNSPTTTTEHCTYEPPTDLNVGGFFVFMNDVSKKNWDSMIKIGGIYISEELCSNV